MGKPGVITNWLFFKQRTHELTIVFLWLYNTVVVTFFPYLYSWRRNYCSNLGGILPKKSGRATLNRHYQRKQESLFFQLTISLILNTMVSNSIYFFRTHFAPAPLSFGNWRAQGYEHLSFGSLSAEERAVECSLVSGSFSNDDGDGSENVKKPIGLDLAKLLCCAFLCRHCTTTAWKSLIWLFMEDGNKRKRIFLSLSKVECGP